MKQMQFIRIIMLAMMTLVLVSTIHAQLEFPPLPAKIDVSATALTKQQDGNYSSNITVIVTDEQGNPSPGANVIFATSKGNLTTAYGFNSDAGGWLDITDNNGTASAVFTIATPESVNITVKVGSSLNATITISQSPTQKGDVTGDGKVDVTDALFIAQYTVGLRTLTTMQLAAGDVNCDGKMDITDALFIAQYTVGLRTTFC
jgi:hypothetical protein